MNESSGLILYDFFYGGMAVSNIDLSIIWLQINVSVSFVVIEVLHVTLSDDQGSFVVGLI